MTVGELRDILAKYDRKKKVGGIGHFGEILEIERVYETDFWDKFIVLEIESAGDEPD